MICTGIAFATFGICGFMLSALAFPIIRLFYQDPEVYTVKTRWLIHKAFALFLLWMKILGVCDFKFEGLEKISEDKGCLLLANHPSLIDVVVLMSLYPRANCIVKKGLWQNPFLKGVVQGAGYIPSDKGEEVLACCQRALDSGDTLVIFPEGTRSVPGKELSLQRGASQVALRLNRPIRLVKIVMYPTTLTKAEAWYQIPRKKPVFFLKIGDKIRPKDFPDKAKPTPVAARVLTREIKRKLEGINS